MSETTQATPHPTSGENVWFAVPKSSNLAEYRYNAETQDFDVKFLNNPQVYRYHDVPVEKVDAFRACQPEGTEFTKGQYFSRNIKSPTFTKLTAEESR